MRITGFSEDITELILMSGFPLHRMFGELKELLRIFFL